MPSCGKMAEAELRGLRVPEVVMEVECDSELPVVLAREEIVDLGGWVDDGGTRGRRTRISRCTGAATEFEWDPSTATRAAGSRFKLAVSENRWTCAYSLTDATAFV
jgi:hypothetical protein